MNKFLVQAMVLVAVMGIAGCEKDGPAERAGEALDESAENLSDRAQDFGNKIEDKCEEMKQEAGAENTNC